MARKDPNSIRGRIRALEIGDHCDFPIEDRDTVRAASFDEGYKLRRKFKRLTLTEQGVYRVTRDQDPIR